ncbi:MAG: M20/M25/M40 family metallo-hydrolase, partial [Candidatus Omnitrophota bacterium]|nr:M20/M25/M40 family metallo-hydrolase [Candidatus Omnitrophota bacterium]
SYNSENPPGNELALSKYIVQDMKSLGLEVKTYTFEKNRPNVVATLKGSWPRARAAKEAILITPHFDTVPIGKGWEFDPLGTDIVGGRIYGRGASDDKGNLASAMEAVRSLVEDGAKLKRDLIMAATVDEETGSHAGIIPLLDKKILKPKVALILDSDEFNSIITQKGLIHMRVQIFGKKAHGAYNWRGTNAIEIASRVINDLKAYRFKFLPHPMLHAPTINIGVIKGGDKVNMVADFCEFAVDVRYLPGMTSGPLLNDIKKLIRRHAKRFRIEIDDLQQPYAMDPEHPFVKTYVQSARKLGLRAPLKGSEGATVITFFKKHGIPAFATGYGAEGTYHTTDEYAEIGTLYRGTQLLERFLKDYDAAV